MTQFKTHVCLVSSQAAPNILPVLDEQMKPENVVLLITEAMKEKAGYLEQVLKPRGIKVQKFDIDENQEFEGLQNQLLEIVSELEESDGDIALNVTGGNKWMAIAAQEVFRSALQKPVFYVDISSDRVMFLDKNIATHVLSEQINLRSYIQAYGYDYKEPSQVQATGANDKLRELCQEMVLNVAEWQGAIGQLNALAAYNSPKARPMFAPFTDVLGNAKDPCLERLLRECKLAELLKYNDEGVTFKGEYERDFANGGWLEVHVNNTLNGLKGNGVIQDSPKLNLHIHKVENKSSHNEVDVAFMAKNRLHIIECKTKRMSGKGGVNSTDTLYKMDSISELGGLGSKSMLVSYRKLNQADRQRAKDLKIRVVEAEQIANLKDALRNWIAQ